MKLFDYEPEPQPEKLEEPPKPTKAQLRFLHQLSRRRLIFRSWPGPGVNVADENGNEIAFGYISRRVADKVVLRGWVDMVRFDGDRALYKLNDAGKDLISGFCEHEHYDESRTEKLADKLICRDCVQQIPCRSKQSQKHGANLFHHYYRAMCNDCLRYLNQTQWPWVKMQ